MAFDVQDDQGSVAGAISYMGADDFRAYHLARGNDVSVYSDAACQRALAVATDYLDNRFAFIGIKQSLEQRTAWPRVAAVDAEGYLRQGIPTEVKEACCEYARIALTGELNPSPAQDVTGRPYLRKKSQVGPILEETEYSAGAAFKMPKYPKADRKLRPLTEAGGLEIARA